MKPAVVPLRDGLTPVPDLLRAWAHDMESGRLPVPQHLLFITDDGEGYELRAVGQMTNMRACHMLTKALGILCDWS